MIVWQNEDGIWSPTTLQKVNLHGIEINADASYTTSKYRFSGALIYAYTRSINQEGQNSFVDKQLAYVPVHTGRASVSIMWRHWLYDVNLNITGIRYTTLDNARAQALDPYGLLDTSLSRAVNVKRFRFRLKAEAFNIFNTY
jgi:iron complex outermembrane receptor protein